MYFIIFRWLCLLKLLCVYRGGGIVCGCSGFLGVYTIIVEVEGYGDSYIGVVIYFIGKFYI